MLEGLPSVELILTSLNEQLVLKALKVLIGRTIETIDENGLNITTLGFVGLHDRLPGRKKLTSFGGSDALLDVSLLEVKVGAGARKLLVLSLEQLGLGLLDDVHCHLEQVVCRVSINAPRFVDKSPVLERVGLVEETLTGETRHLTLDNDHFVLVDDRDELLVSLVVGSRVQGEHVSLETTTLLKEGINVLLTLLLGLLLELLGRDIGGITLLIGIEVQVVAQLLCEGSDAATRADAAQDFENVAVCHLYLFFMQKSFTIISIYQSIYRDKL